MVRVSGTASTSLSTPDFYGTTMHGCATTTQYSLGTHLPLSVSGSLASSDWRDTGEGEGEAEAEAEVRVRVRVSGTASTSLSTPDFYGTTMHGCATTTQYSLGRVRVRVRVMVRERI